MGHKNSSSEINRMVSSWKSGIIEYVDEMGELQKCKDEPTKLLTIFNRIRNDSRMRLTGKGLRKAFELKDIPDKIWTFIRKIKYLPTYFRSKRNKFLYRFKSIKDELRQIIKKTCCFGPLDKGDDK